jgi:hypothetical protein
LARSSSSNWVHPIDHLVPKTGKGALIHEIDLAHEQLKRMRGMTRYYHDRFFSDVRYVTTAVIALFVVGFWAVPEAFLLAPVVALIGANQTAFDASYLYLARHYAAELENEVNQSMRRQILVGAELEDRYLFPLSRPKVVAMAKGADFSWFGWMTLLYTALGVLAFAAGISLGWETLAGAGTGWLVFYLGGVGVLTVGSLVAGWWWFVNGTGERRLREVLETRFGRPVSRSNVRPLSG